MALLKKSPIKAAQEFVQIVSMKEDYFILRNGEYRAIIEVQPLNFPLLNELEQESVVNRYGRLLNSLYYYSQILIYFTKIDVNKYLISQYNSYKKAGMADNELAKAELKFTKGLLESNKTLEQKFYVVIGSPKDYPENAVSELKSRVDHQIKELEKNGLIAKRLIGGKLERLIIEASNGMNKGRTILDRSTPAKIDFYEDYVKSGDLFIRTLYVDQNGYPDVIGFDFMDNIMDIQETINFSIHIHPSREGSYEKLVKKAAKKLRIEMGWQNYMNRPVEEDDERIREGALALGRGSGRFKLFGVSIYIEVKAKSLNELERVTKKITTKLQGLMMEAYPLKYFQEDGYKSTLPIGMDCYLKPKKQERILPTQVVARLFPFRSSAMADEKGVILGVDPDTNSLVTVDLFSQANPHLGVLAESGAGKTFSVDTIIHRYLLRGVPAIIVEPLVAHKRYVKAMGGQYIEATVDSQFTINPNDLPLVKGPGTLRNTILKLHSFYGMAAGRELTPKERNDLDKALYIAYEKRGIIEDDIISLENEPPLPSEVQDQINKIGSKDLAESLERLTRGTYSKLFNGQTQINFESNLVGISTRNLELAIAPLFLFNLMNKISDKLTFDKSEAIFAVDEYYQYFGGRKEYEPFALLLQSTIKSFRHYNTAVIPITQDIGDALDNDLAKALITIPNTILLFEQKKINITTIDRDIVSLSSRAKDYLTSAGRGYGLIKSGGRYAKVQVLATPELEKLIATDPNRLRELGVR